MPQDETYGNDRAKALVELLRELAQRIDLLSDEQLLQSGPDLQKRMGDIRRELFLYEVRSTFDTPEVAESRRIVEEATGANSGIDFESDKPDWMDDDEPKPWE